MLRKILRVKIHSATVTDKNLFYEGSLTLDREIMEKAGLLPFESIWVYNLNNGARFETYLMEGEKGQVILNGAAARLGEVGDKLILVSYAWVEERDLLHFKTKVLYLDEKNEILQSKSF